MSTKMRAVRPKERGVKVRRLFVVDIENMVGGAVTDFEEAAHAWRLLKEAAGLRSQDQVVVGACHLSALAAGLTRTPSRLLVQSDDDGADLRLLEVLETENIAGRYGEVVLVSGDGIFTDAVRALQTAGVRVTVVSRFDALSTRLKFTADLVRLLPSLDDFRLAA